MELKNSLAKPYTEEDRITFIVEQNHRNGYDIRETEEALEAWGQDANDILECKKASVRAVRDSLLRETDLFMIVDYPVSDDDRESYKAYRQYLRDYPAGDDWYESNPKRYDEWKVVGESVESTDEVVGESVSEETTE